ncbi:unnamed protein product [Rotaria magnacalcarata]|uniref:C2H2-type domain-containing protein n=2 Tax=Rotaria magnacalcarata TaxID=392030 RepID=A0A815WD53_9BILA|nr:unnamed protein product [Rotaria magnacalcarata]CAF1651732.1 unnamed protein product [Rotaria magnacalcarata]
MANVFSLCNDIEQFLQQSDKNSIDQFLNWLKSRFNISSPSNIRKSDNYSSESLEKSIINSSQIFTCQCGHRFSFRCTIDNLIETSEFNDIDKQSKVNGSKLQNSSKDFLCNQCQIRLHTHETFLHHYSMHEKGYLFCKHCFQFYINDQTKLHDCEQRKLDELQSLEQLIPPDTIEQQQSSNPINYVNDHDRSSSTRTTRFDLPKLTDSIVEIIHTDGKRQYRCPLCFNSYVNRSGLNRHYITHSSQDIWKVECQFCGKRYSRKDSLKHHIKTQHAHFIMSNLTWTEKDNALYHQSNERLYQSNNKNSLDGQSNSSLSSEKEQMENDDIVVVN